MNPRHYRESQTKDLLKWKELLVAEKENWERRVREQTENFNTMLRPISEYKTRIRKCKRSIKQIDKVLKERGVEIQ